MRMEPWLPRKSLNPGLDSHTGSVGVPVYCADFASVRRFRDRCSQTCGDEADMTLFDRLFDGLQCLPVSEMEAREFSAGKAACPVSVLHFSLVFGGFPSQGLKFSVATFHV